MMYPFRLKGENETRVVSILFLWPPKQKQREVAARIAIISALQWTLEREPLSSWDYGWFLLERERETLCGNIDLS